MFFPQVAEQHFGAVPQHYLGIDRFVFVFIHLFRLLPWIFLTTLNIERGTRTLSIYKIDTAGQVLVAQLKLRMRNVCILLYIHS